MRRTTIIFAALLAVAVTVQGKGRKAIRAEAAPVVSAMPYVANRAPLAQSEYMELPLGSIRARGWMLEQLRRQRDGLTGHLDSIYAHVMGRRNGWLGGDGDVWERGPYWIDGLLPLAYILDDPSLKEKVQPWIEWTLKSQKSDGYFGPDTDRPYEAGLQRDNAHDWWPKMVMLKVMQQYYNATGDQRVISFLTRYFRYQLQQLPATPLGHWTFWGEQRGGDNLQVVYWLYNITGDKFLLDLARLIHRQTFDWTGVFLSHDQLTRPLSLHCVNLGQGFKEPAVYWQQSQDNKQLEALQAAKRDIRHTIGLPTGLWGGDELLRFGDPTVGSELCTAVEMMFSLESVLRITGDPQWADWLERVAYNALPTQTTADYTARQYFQQTNQVRATREWRNFSTPHDDTDNIFGELNGYPCCTSNMHQGWPKLVQNLFYATADHGVAALVYAPSAVSLRVADGVDATITEQTDYPFSGQVTFTVNIPKKQGGKASFPFHLRIPAWCGQPEVRVNGGRVAVDAVPGRIAKVYRTWRDGDRLTLSLPMHVSVDRWFEGGAVVERGPLVYALKMDERWTKKAFDPNRDAQYGKWYWEVTSDTPWNYALPTRVFRQQEADKLFTVKEDGLRAAYPWTVDAAPVTITMRARHLNGWTLNRGSVGQVAYFTQQGHDVGDERTIELVPYGCTRLRVAEFPVRPY